MSLITIVPYELSYGPHLIGEGSPFSVGAFFMLAFLLVICFLTSANEGRVRLLLLIFAAMLFACLVITQSRITLLGTILGAPFVIATAWNHRRRALATVVIAGILGFILSGVAGLREAEPVVIVVLPTSSPVLASSTPPRATGLVTPGPVVIAVPNPREALAVGVVSRLSASLIEFSLAQRSGIWIPVLDKAIDRPWTGYGKGALGDVAGLDWIEAHDHYLRVFVESGAFGLASFVGLLGIVFRMSWSLLRHPQPATRLTGQFVVAATAAMASVALLQDAFLAVLPNELYWLSVGIAGSLAYAAQRRKGGSGRAAQ
jgi:O-antigen ligase